MIQTRSPSVTMCCSPGCETASAKQVASLPLCHGHFNRLESHIAQVHYSPLWKKIERDVERHDWVYFVRIDQAIKIGYSSQLLKRLRSFAAYGHDVTLLGLEYGGRDLEARIHRKFIGHKARVGTSRELFEPVPEILAYIEKGRGCAYCSKKALPGRVLCTSHHTRIDFTEEERLIGVQLHAELAAFQ